MDIISEPVDFSGPKAKRPFAQWADGQIRRAVRGEDFDCTPRVFENSIRGWAKKRGMTVNATRGADCVTFRINPADAE